MVNIVAVGCHVHAGSIIGVHGGVVLGCGLRQVEVQVHRSTVHGGAHKPAVTASAMDQTGPREGGGEFNKKTC